MHALMNLLAAVFYLIGGAFALLAVSLLIEFAKGAI
jgi:hypothetical protein